MGVYIPGMKIPGSCSECLDIGWQYVFECRLDDSEEGKRLVSCPLVPVPEHGRLIDADALAHDLDDDVENDQRALDEMDFVGKERERVQFDKDCKQNCMWYLSEASTIIPADKEGEG